MTIRLLIQNMIIGNTTNKSIELKQNSKSKNLENVIDGLFENWNLNNPNVCNGKIM